MPLVDFHRTYFRIAIILLIMVITSVTLSAQDTRQQRQLMQLRSLSQQAAQTDDRNGIGIERAESELIRDVMALEEPVDPENYIVGPGDFFSINIISLENVLVAIPVGPTGDLMIPNVGSISLAGKKLSDSVQEITDFIAVRFIGSDIYVNLQRLRSFRIYVYGAVTEPGYFEITPMMRLSDLLEKSELRQLALLNQIAIHHSDNTETRIDLFEFKLNGDRSQNPRLKEGDQVFIPFGRADQDAVVVRGELEEGDGYTTIRTDENLHDFLNRRAQYSTAADLKTVSVIRHRQDMMDIISVSPNQFQDFVLQGGDEILLSGQRSVNIHGYVAAPGSFPFFPGFTAADYVSQAGGLLPVGTMNGLRVTRVDGTVLRGEDVLIQRGDVIEVNKSLTGTMFGDVSVLNILTAAATITLAAVAAFRR